MYVKVMYYKDESNGYGGREYTYTTLLALKEGDKVIAPTAKEPRQKALVTEINVPVEEIDEAWRDKLKEITEVA